MSLGKRLLRRGLLGIAGGLMLAVGLGIMTAAAWIALAAVAGHLVAALAIGLSYSGVGLILLALAGEEAPPTQETPPPQPDLVQAFFRGVGAGAAARQGYKKGRKG